MGVNLDPQVVAMVRAIRQHESGGNFNAKGGSGEFGAYQFMPKTWQSWAGRFLGNPNAQMTKANQNKVAYMRVLELKNQGYNPGQIASIWNHGSPNFKGVVGVNSAGVHYDTPGYVRKVYSLYKQFVRKPIA